MLLNPKVKDTSWHYQWWQGTYRIFWLTPPTRFSICPYFWRVALFSWLFFYPMGIILRVVAAPFQLVRWLWSFLPQRTPKPRICQTPFSEKHPSLAKAGKFLSRLSGKILVALYLVAVVTWLVVAIVKSPWPTMIAIGIFAAGFGMIAIVLWALKTDTAHLVGEFIKAKKQQVCPYVEVIRS